MTILTHCRALSFSLRFLFLATTITAVSCTLAVTVPGVGVLLAILLMSAFARTCLAVRERSEGGYRVSRGERTTLFVQSVLRMTIVLTLLIAIVPVMGALLVVVVISSLAVCTAHAFTAAIAAVIAVVMVRWLITLGRVICSSPSHYRMHERSNPAENCRNSFNCARESRVRTANQV
jgi:hypothetical protein